MVLALVMRVLWLDLRPPHFDEGINGWFVDQMWNQGFYRYDPTNYHGPLYFYLLQLSELLLGRGIVTFRLITALIATAIVAVVVLHRRWFGDAALWAGLVLAVSPGMAFYGRYAIHESLLVLSQAAFLYGFIRWRLEGGRLAVGAMAAGIVGSVATKETFFIFLGTWFIALTLVWVLERSPLGFALASPEAQTGGRTKVSNRFLLATFVISVLILLTLFSGFFMNPSGVVDMINSIAPWIRTGTGELSGHDKPFYYWLELLWRYEWPLLLAVFAWPLLIWHGSRWAWRLAATGFGVFLAYSLIPYKTPWLIVGILFPLAFVFGFLMDLARTRLTLSWRRAAWVVGGGLLLVSLGSSLRLNVSHYADFQEPYVYVHTSTDVSRLMENLESLVQLRPHERNMSIMIFAPDIWPLPWLLEPYPGLSYFSITNNMQVQADVMLVEHDDADSIERAIDAPYARQALKVRDAQETRWVYYRMETFAPVLPASVDVVQPPGGVPTP